MIGSKKQCRYCSYFRFGELIVIDVNSGCRDTYDGVCSYAFRRTNLVPVNLIDDCSKFKYRGVKK